MTEQIQTARMISARLKRLYEARAKVTELLYVLLRGDEGLTNPLKETLQRLDNRIKIYQTEIKNVIESIPGYDKDVHLEVIYLSSIDLNAGVLDLSIQGDGSSLLDLNTGELLIL